MTRGVQFGAQVEHQVGVGDRLQFCRVVVGPERRQDILGVVDEVQDERRVLSEVVGSAVESRQSLDRLNAGEALVNIHAAELALVEPGLELVGDE